MRSPGGGSAMMRGELASELASECAAVFGGATMRGVAAREAAAVGGRCASSVIEEVRRRAGSRSAELPAPLLYRQIRRQDQAAEMILGRSGRLVMPLQR